MARAKNGEAISARGRSPSARKQLRRFIRHCAKAGDLDERDLWDKYTVAYRDVLKKCSTEWAPWYVVPSDRNKARNYLIAKRIVTTLEGLNLSYPEPKTDLKHYLKSLGA